MKPYILTRSTFPEEKAMIARDLKLKTDVHKYPFRLYDGDDGLKHKNKDYFVQYFVPIEKARLQMPQKYLQKREFLEWHLDCVFEKKKEVIV
jgi:hypothetical protein